MKSLAETFADLNYLLKKFESMDPNTGRFSLTERNVHDALSAYKQICDEKEKDTKQATMAVFLKRATPPPGPQRVLRRFRKKALLSQEMPAPRV